MKNNFPVSGVFLIILLIISTINSYCQSTFFKIIDNSELTESVSCINEITPGKYLIKSFARCEFCGEFDGINALYMINNYGKTTDSVFITTLDQYHIFVRQLILSTENELLLFCTAMDSITMDLQLCLIKTDNHLNINSYNFYGSNDSHEYILDFCINSNNNMVFVGSNSYQALMGGYLLWEMDFNFNTISYTIDSTYTPFVPDIMQMPANGKYYVNDGSNGLLIFNPDFELDSIGFINTDSTDFIPFPQDHKLIDNHRYLKTGIQFVFDGIGVPVNPWDMAFVILNEHFEICAKNVYGTEDTTDFTRNIDWIDTSRIFLSGVKNYTNQPPEDSWISLYITNLQGETIQNRFYGGYGNFDIGAGLATSDGGYLMAYSWFDFENYIPPGQMDWDIVIIKVDSDGLITNIDTQFPFKVSDVIVYPNPVKDNLHFELGIYSNLQLSIYNSTGERKIFKSLHHSQTIDISSLTSGIYVYLLTGKNEFKETGKIIKE
jgi:hypothetical protein